MPGRLRRYRRFIGVRRDHSGPLTCRHRRRCDCKGKTNKGEVCPIPPLPGTKPPQPAPRPWENEQARAVIAALNPFPEAKAAFIEAVMAQYKAELP